jgi:hypothetical protein
LRQKKGNLKKNVQETEIRKKTNIIFLCGFGPILNACLTSELCLVSVW